MLRDTISPSEEGSLCNHRVVVDCDRLSVVAIFLLPMPAVALFSMTTRSCADRTILVARILTNTCVLDQIWLWYTDVLSRVGVVRRCEMCKNLLSYHTFFGGVHCSSKGAQNRHDVFFFWAPPSPCNGSMEKKTTISYKKLPKHKETEGPKNAKGSELDWPPCIQNFEFLNTPNIHKFKYSNNVPALGQILDK